MRAELGIEEPTIPYAAGAVRGKAKEHQALYRNVRTRLHGLLSLMDPSPLPKNRRLHHDAFAAAVARREQVLSNEELALRYDRLNWFINELIETSIELLPRAVRRRWKGSVAVDATAVAAFARPSRPRHGKKSWGKGAPIEVVSADPDAGMYIRKQSNNDDDPAASKKSFWAYEATLVVAGADDPGTASVFPTLVMGMAPLHQPGREPGVNAVRALRSMSERGHPPGWLAGDRAYTDAKAEHFALPARALGYKPVLDYAEDHLGVQGSQEGFVFVEGALYCPAIPAVLTSATMDFRKKTIDEATYQARLAERRRYAALPKAGVDDEGFQRWRCPSSNPHPVAACVLKPASQHHDGRVRLAVHPSQSLITTTPRCCKQGSVTIGPAPLAKLRQDLLFQSPEWAARYHALRSTIEGMNGYLKDGAREALDDPERRRIHGVAAQSLFVALLVFAANVRKIQEFMKNSTVGDRSRRRLPRRRSGQPLAAWQPGSVVEVDHPDPSGST